MPKHIIMDQTGHSEHVFDRADIVSMEEAEARFKELTGRGFRAATRQPGGDAMVVDAFDPTAEETVFIPPLQGG